MITQNLTHAWYTIYVLFLACNKLSLAPNRTVCTWRIATNSQVYDALVYGDI